MVVAPDLPGHGFTESPPLYRLSLPGMAAALTGLLCALRTSPVIVVGHSAGAAILIRMCLNGDIAPQRLVSLNGALLPLRGLPGRIFSPAAKLLASNSLVPRLFARQASDRRVIERLLRDTGSILEPAGVEQYRRLAGNARHVAAALGMMANWDLSSFARELPRLKTPLMLIAAEKDRTIRPIEAFRARELLPTAALISLPGLGHLAHEERPREVAKLIIEAARSAGVLPK